MIGKGVVLNYFLINFYFDLMCLFLRFLNKRKKYKFVGLYGCGRIYLFGFVVFFWVVGGELVVIESYMFDEWLIWLEGFGLGFGKR